MRKTKTITIEGPEGDRDAGKKFLITEMSAVAADAWAQKAFGAMIRSGVEISLDVLKSGMEGIALTGVKSLFAAPWNEVAPLMADLLACVQIVEVAVTRPLLESDVEEIKTITRLRDEVFQVHTNFSPLATLLVAMMALTGPTTDPEPEIS